MTRTALTSATEEDHLEGFGHPVSQGLLADDPGCFHALQATNNAGRQALLGILGLAPPAERPPASELASFSTPPLSAVSMPLHTPPVVSPLPASADNQQGAEKGRAILNLLRSGGKAAASTTATLQQRPAQGAEPQGNKTALLCSVLGLPGMGTG